jgi:hypothetical protein
MSQLTRVVFNKWYTDLLQENLKVVPDTDPNSKPEIEEEDYITTRKPVAQTMTPVIDNNKGPGLKKMSAEEIIFRSGSKRDIHQLNMHQDDEIKIRETKDRLMQSSTIDSEGVPIHLK